MKITRLTASNVKRLRAVRIEPDGNVVTISGANGAGKSSVLDSIEYALGGKGGIPPKPVRQGSKKAEIVCELGDIVVRRTMSSSGTTQLRVEGADGSPMKSPQKILDELVGRLTFDPLEFSRMKPTQQAEALRAIVGLDTTEIDELRCSIFSRRTELNRDMKTLQAQLAAAPGPHVDVPVVPMSSSAIVAEMDAAETANATNDRVRDRARDMSVMVGAMVDEIEQIHDSIKQNEDAIAALREQLASKEKALSSAEKNARSETSKAEALVDVDIAPLKDKLAALDDVNQKVRDNEQRAVIVDRLDETTKAVHILNMKIEDIDEKKEAIIAAAKFPVDGLGFSDESSVTMNGLPLEQASQAEQLRTSVAIGLAQNPKLRVLLIRDGSLLDPNGMKLLAEMADEADAQLWVERVEDDQPGAVVIEDGHVKAEEVT